MTAFLLPLAAAIPVAWALVIRHHSIVPDAQSRLSDAYYMLFSRDPHAAAVGFVWNPLPSLVDLPLLLVKSVWPVLATESFASNLMTCLFFAFCCYQLYRYLEELHLNVAARWGLWLCFAANPLVFYYAVNGMSEMVFLGTLIPTVRYLSRWVESGSTRGLMVAGFATAFAYLAREEAVATAGACAVLVAIVTYRRTTGSTSRRRSMATVDVAVYASPFAVAFVVWAIMSWVIVGHPFEQFSSLYGNSEQVRSAGPIIQKAAASRLLYALKGSQAVAPLLALVVVLGLIRARWLRDSRILVPISVVLSVLIFEIVTYTGHQTFPWFRYYIYACPAAVMSAACLMAPNTSGRPAVLAAGRSVLTLSARTAAVVLTALALVLVAPGVLTTADTLGTPGGVGSSDRYQLAYFLWPHASDAPSDVALANYYAVKNLSSQIDSMHLPRGSFMVDVFTPCMDALILNSSHPAQYVIPSDQDYQEKFGAPYQFGVRYFLVPDPATNPIDALNRHLPGLFANGQDGLASLVRQINAPGCPILRLYRVNPGGT